MSHRVRHWGRSVWIYINHTQRWECLTRWDIGKGVFEFIEIIPKVENVSPGETWGGGGFVYYRNQTQEWKCLTRWDIGEGDVYRSYLKLNMSHPVRHWGRSAWIHINHTQRRECFTWWDIGEGLSLLCKLLLNRTQRRECLTWWDISGGVSFIM